MSLTQIATILGVKKQTVQKRSVRDGWRMALEKAKDDAGRLAVADAQANVVQQAQLWSNKVVKVIERSIDRIEQLPLPESIKGMEQHQQLIQLHVDVGRKVFGLDDASKRGPIINVAVMADLRRNPTVPANARIVDVDLPDLPE